MMVKVDIKFLLCCKLGIEFPKMVDINDQSEILLSNALLQQSNNLMSTLNIIMLDSISTI